MSSRCTAAKQLSVMALEWKAPAVAQDDLLRSA